MNTIKKLNSGLLLKMERQKVQQELQSVKKVRESVLDGIPMMTFGEGQKTRGWRTIYLGLYSPFTNKYTQFMSQAINVAKQKSYKNVSPVKSTISKRKDSYQLQSQNSFNQSITQPHVQQQTQLQSQNTQSQSSQSAVKNQSLSLHYKSNNRLQVNSNEQLAFRKSEDPSARNTEAGYCSGVQLSRLTWHEQQELRYIEYFNNMSQHKREFLESQIRNGSQNFLAQKYLQLIQSKKLDRSLQDIFICSVFNKSVAGYYLARSESYCNQTLDHGNNYTDESTIEIVEDNYRALHKALSVKDFKYMDFRWPGISKITLQKVNNKDRASSCGPKFDLRLINKFIMNKFIPPRNLQMSLQNLKTVNQHKYPHKRIQEDSFKRQILRRKSCECLFCGGAIQKVPCAAIYEEESDMENQEDRDSQLLSLSIQIQPGFQQKRTNFIQTKSALQSKTGGSSPLSKLSSPKKDMHTKTSQFSIKLDQKISPEPNSRTSFSSLAVSGVANNIEVSHSTKPKTKIQINKKKDLSPIWDIEKQVKKRIGLNKMIVQYDDKDMKQSNVIKVSRSKKQSSKALSPIMRRPREMQVSSSSSDSSQDQSLSVSRKSSQIQSPAGSLNNIKIAQSPHKKMQSKCNSSELLQLNKQPQKPFFQSRNQSQKNLLKTIGVSVKKISNPGSLTLSQRVIFTSQSKFLSKLAQIQPDMKYTKNHFESATKHNKSDQKLLQTIQSNSGTLDIFKIKQKTFQSSGLKESKQDLQDTQKDKFPNIKKQIIHKNSNGGKRKALNRDIKTLNRSYSLKKDREVWKIYNKKLIL